MPSTTSKALGGPVATQNKQHGPLPSGITVQELKQMTAMRMAQHQELQRQAQVHQGPAPSGFASSASFPAHILPPGQSVASVPAQSLAPAPAAPAPTVLQVVVPGPAPASPDRVGLSVADPLMTEQAVLAPTAAAAAAATKPPFPPAPAPGPTLEHFTKPNNEAAQSNSAFPPMPHGLTVQELKELTRMRLAREAGIVASYQAAAAAASAAAMQPSSASSGQPAPKGKMYHPPSSAKVGAAGASGLGPSNQSAGPSELLLPEPALMPGQQSVGQEKSAASNNMIRMYGMEVSPLPLRDPSPSSTSFLRRPSPPLSSSFPPVTSAGLIFETSLAQNARVSRGLNPLGHLGRDGSRRVVSMEGDEPFLMYAPPPGLGQDDEARARTGMRLMTPMQHIRPPQPIRSGSGDLVMNPIRKSSSQNADLEAMSRQMAEYVLLTPKSPHTSILAGDPFGAAAAILQQQREVEQRGGAYQYRVVRSPSGELAASLANGRPPLRRTNQMGPSQSSSSSSGMRPAEKQQRWGAFTFDEAAVRRHMNDDEGAVPTPPVVDSSEDEEQAPESGVPFTDGMSPTVRTLESMVMDEAAGRRHGNNGFLLGAAKVSVEGRAGAEWRGR